jgi:succinyl-diaminopimelate desuccinylase
VRELERATELILREIEDSREEITDFLRELVSIPTVNPPGTDYEKCARLISRKLKAANIESKLVEVSQGELKASGVDLPRVSVLGNLKGTIRKPVLHINGHFDVVPPGSGWTCDPFGGEIRDGNLYGRGSSDMKGSLAAAIMTLVVIARTGIQLKGDVTLSATPDEETGGELGAGYLLKNGLVRGDGCVVAEGAGVNEVSMGHKGVLWMEVRTHGRATHASRPHLGVNAVTKMANVIIGLNELSQKLEKKRTESSKLFMDTPCPSLMVGGTIRGGIKTNIVPDSCVLTLDRRLLLEENTKEAEDEVLSSLAKLRSEDAELDVQANSLLRIEPMRCDPNAEILQTLVRSVTKTSGVPPRIIATDGFTDAHYFATQMPTVMHGAGLREQGHTKNEYVVIDHVIRTCKTFALSAIDMLL